MSAPKADRAGNQMFYAHEYIGMVAFVAALGFWVILAVRRQGTPVSKLYPWFTQGGRASVIKECLRAYEQARARRIPEIGEDDALPSAIHGLGLALVSLMAAFGVFWYAVVLAGYGNSLVAWGLINLHAMLGNLVWAYLIGHAGMSIVHQLLGHPVLGKMWSFPVAETRIAAPICVRTNQPE